MSAAGYYSLAGSFLRSKIYNFVLIGFTQLNEK